MTFGGILIHLRDVLEIGILSLAIYYLLLFFRGRIALRVLTGLLVIIFAGIISQKLGLETISWIVRNLFAVWVVAILIVFQPELRRGLARIGHNPFLSGGGEEFIDEVVKASNFLSRNKYGALIVIQDEIGLKDYIETGVTMDAEVTSELITTIFTPHTSLHDGAIIIDDEKRIVAANCILPLQEMSEDMQHLGSRHRAGMTLSKETDATIIIISEETGGISLASKGKLRTDLDGLLLRDALKDLLGKKKGFRIKR